MKIAHLILAHSRPDMLERLADRLQHSDADIYEILGAHHNLPAAFIRSCQDKLGPAARNQGTGVFGLMKIMKLLRTTLPMPLRIAPIIRLSPASTRVRAH